MLRFGNAPPSLKSLGELCPKQHKCPDCSAQVCDVAARMYGLNVIGYNDSLPGMPNRVEGVLCSFAL